MSVTRLIQRESDLADLPNSTETFHFLKPTDSHSFRASARKGCEFQTLKMRAANFVG